MTEKEIGMEKLMKYVEEMQKEGINICRPQFQEYYLVEMMLISKYYGLIQWLVDNDKIKDYHEGNDDIDYVREKYGFYEALLMLLSIQDEPIEFLISILK